MDNYELLKQYKDLLDTGVITQEEFDAKKRELLAGFGMAAAPAAPETPAAPEVPAATTATTSIPTEAMSGTVPQQSTVPAYGATPVPQTDAVPAYGEAPAYGAAPGAQMGMGQTAQMGMAPAAPAAPVKKKKTGLIIGIVIGALVIIGAAAFFLLQPKVTSISATYNGSCTKGTVIDSNSPLTVTATYDNGETKEVSGWTVDSTTLRAGVNTINVSYKGTSTSLSLYAPLMENGKYVANCGEIRDTVDYFASNHVSGYTGLDVDTSISALAYSFGGVGFMSRMDFFSSSTEMLNDEYEVPHSVYYMAVLDRDGYDTTVPVMLDCIAAIYTAVDPDVSYDDGKEIMRSLISTTADTVYSDIGFYVDERDNMKITCMLVFAEDGVVVTVSFDELD